jgi:hypothetical protein
MKLLFTIAHWHGLAKMRLHTDETLEILDDLTTSLGNQLRLFCKTTCNAYETLELPKEARARQRPKKTRQRNAQSQKKTSRTPQMQTKATVEQSATQTGSKSNIRKFNLNTYKFHALGDYVEAIRLFGTADSYSTEPVIKTFLRL